MQYALCILFQISLVYIRIDKTGIYDNFCNFSWGVWGFW